MSPRPKYPHMMPLEVPIWDRFLASTDIQFTRLIYDVHVGEGAPIPEYASPAEVTQIQAITRKRIDVVGWSQGSVWLFEVKSRAGQAAAGQLLNYKRLFRREYRPLAPIRLAVVCERLEWDVEDYYRELGITVFIV